MDDLIQVKQGTPEWHQARCGFVTASAVWKVTAKTAKGEPATEREKYRCLKTIERVTGRPIDNGFVSRAMQDGREREPEARINYVLQTQQPITECGFIHHPTIAWCGASPDGLVEGGMIEIKCPEHLQHSRTVELGEIDGRYIQQMNLQLACMPDREFIDFVSFHPDFPVWAQLKIIRHHRDNTKIARLEEQVRTFLAEVDKAVLWWQRKAQDISLMEALQRSAAEC